MQILTQHGGEARNLLQGGKRGGLGDGTEVPQRRPGALVPGQSPGGGLEAKPPEAGDKC